ncbi:MAG: DUF1730 domain-containing protein [Myxococcales bacterium]|nr:DUF1730 domain-containing protein [Myxococcales bacterium]
MTKRPSHDLRDLPGHRPAEWSFLADAASALGFCAVGVAPVAPFESSVVARFDAWRQEGRHAQMRYLERWDEVRWHPGHEGMLPGASAVVSVALPVGEGRHRDGLWALVAAHARGRDYHATIKDKLTQLSLGVRRVFAQARFRVCVDSAPVPERSWALRCGLGTLGKNGALMVPGVGPGVLLGELICADVPPPPSAEAAGGEPSCAQCMRCVAACPTGALGGDGSVDARRCLSYHSIENRGDVPEAVARQMTLLFGCDICLSVCPQHNPAVESQLVASAAATDLPPTLASLLHGDTSQWQHSIADTCLHRTGAAALRRNAALVCRNLKQGIHS